ncbi:MAG: diacylglycerol/lipid kinase family protein [Actinomycetota bacterium]
MSILFVCNPISGGSDEADRSELVAALAPLGRVVVHEPGDRASFADDLRSAARDVSRVVVGAGDGTLDLTVAALIERTDEIVFGVLPMGTGNDFTRTLGLPADPLEAAHAIAQGNELVVDTGRVLIEGETRPFINACMGGFPVAVDEAISERQKKSLGPVAFWLGGLKAATDLDRYRVIVNGVAHDDVVAIGIGNGRTAGGGIEVFPHADPSDGHLDICVMRADGLIEAAKLAAKVRSGDHTDEPFVSYDRAVSVEVAATPSLGFNVDGEVDGIATPARFEVGPKARFLVPAR